MKQLTTLAALFLILSASHCGPPPPMPYLGCFDIYIKDQAGVDLIEKNLAKFVPEVRKAPFCVPLPRELYDVKISVNEKNVEPPVMLDMYYTTDMMHPYSLGPTCDLQRYYERAGKPERGTVIYTLTFPLLFGDNRTLQIEMDWIVKPYKPGPFFKNGHYLWYDKIMVDGKLMPIPTSSDLYITI